MRFVGRSDSVKDRAVSCSRAPLPHCHSTRRRPCRFYAIREINCPQTTFITPSGPWLDWIKSCINATAWDLLLTCLIDTVDCKSECATNQYWYKIQEVLFEAFLSSLSVVVIILQHIILPLHQASSVTQNSQSLYRT